MPPVSPALAPGANPGYRDNAPQRPRGGPAIVLSLTSLGGAEGLPGRARLERLERQAPRGRSGPARFHPAVEVASGFPARGGIALPGAPWTPSDARPRTSRRREVRGKSSNNKLWKLAPRPREVLAQSLTLHSAPSARLTSPRPVIAPAGRRPNTFPRGRLRERTF